MIFIYLSTLTSAVLFFLSKPSGFNFIDSPWLYSSQLFALIGATLLCLNYILSARLKFIEKIFGGLDKLYKTHHVLGALSFVLVLNHPIFLIIKSLPSQSIAKTYFTVGSDFSYNAGIFALYSLILILVFTFIIKLPYQHWLSIHKLMGIPLFFTIVHVSLISSDVSNFYPLRIWILTLLFFATISYLYKLLIYNRFGPNYQYKVDRVVGLGQVTEIYLSPISREIKFKAGQFIFAIFNGGESHPFTISSSSQDKSIRLSVKSLGDYTSVVNKLTKGSTATLSGPYGQFGQRFFEDKPIVCIAGGIGITPFLSLISTEIHHPLSRLISLYYTTKTESEAVYNREIINTQKSLNGLRYFLHPTATQNYLTAAKIQSDIPEFNNSLFFICGPTSLMQSISAQLQQLGIKRKDIIYEDFSLTDVN